MMNTNFAVTGRDEIRLPDAPVIAGLVFRHFRGESDYPPMLAVLAASCEADQDEFVRTLEDVVNTYTHLNNCDPYQDMVMVEVNDQLVGYSRTGWFKEEPGPYIHYHFFFLRPEWRGRGLERTLLLAMERRAAEVAASLPQDALHELSLEIQETQPALEALAQQAGYRPVRYFYEMVRPTLDDIPDLALPAGVEVRPVLPEHYRAIWEAADEAFRDHWGYAPQTEENYQEWLAGRLFQPELWQVAWAGEQVVGTVLNFIDEEQNRHYGRRRGYTETITVRRPWRKQGVARALIARSLHLLKAQGMTEAALGVDTENLSGALRLYEGMGFRPVKRTGAYRKPLE